MMCFRVTLLECFWLQSGGTQDGTYQPPNIITPPLGPCPYTLYCLTYHCLKLPLPPHITAGTYHCHHISPPEHIVLQAVQP
mmetsp:Transcript_19411/g.42047  ORF Transcript_19411/g.42047 Transcript_19411/m.42047 type:complete len:81 (-) Transcript_19411:688-930(-)